MCALALLISVGIATAVIFWQHPSPVQAQDVPAGFPPPSEIISQMMSLIGQNKIDEATAMMDGLKDQPDARNIARDKLIHLRDEQGVYRGYDIAASQRFTGQFQIVDVMAYYDQQPVLMRFHFYRPQLTSGWNVLGFQIQTSVQDITTILHDMPVDYRTNKK